ncbi:hypothetical protein NW754_003230 [Fusarium falciforme]|nr:hypothetical protein NW754_003230 [Fusarium falciforme]
MALTHDPNNPYDLENVSHGLMQLASATGVGFEPELRRVSVDTNQANWQRDVTESANMVENHESRLPSELDAPINYSYQPPLSASSFSMSESLSDFPSTSRTHEHLERGSESRRLQPRTRRHKTGNRPPRRNNASRPHRMPQPCQKYACPLYLQNREKHKRCKNCVLTTWTRVLQHLKRTHLAKEDHCPTCRRSFSSETLKNEHIRLGNCQLVNIAHSGVFLKEDYDNLKYIRQNSDKEKWKEAWRRLFRGLPTPSPFHESDAEIITRTGRSACIKALRKAAQGHGDLSALADELLGDLTHMLVPAARGDNINTTAPVVSQAADPAHHRHACSPGRPLDQAKQFTRGTAHLRDLPEANPLMVPLQVPPDTPLPSQEQSFAQPPQIPPDLHGAEQFGPEAPQSWLSMHSMASQFLQHMLNALDLSLPPSSFATPTNLHNNAYNYGTSFLSDKEMISGEWTFGQDEAEEN